MIPRKGQDDLPHKSGRKEISPQRGLIFYVVLSTLIHWLALATLVGPSFGPGGSEALRAQQSLAVSLHAERPASRKEGEPTQAAPTRPAVAAKTKPSASAPEKAKEKSAVANGEHYFLSIDVDETAKPISFGPLIYPVEQLLNSIPGAVVVDVLIDSNGNVDGVRIMRSEPPGVFEEAAIAAIAETTFRPARRGGLPVRSVKRIEVNFDPREESAEH